MIVKDPILYSDLRLFRTVGHTTELCRYLNWWQSRLQDDGLVNEFNDLALREWGILVAHNKASAKEFIWIDFIGRWVRKPLSYLNKIYTLSHAVSDPPVWTSKGIRLERNKTKG